MWVPHEHICLHRSGDVPRITPQLSSIIEGAHKLWTNQGDASGEAGSPVAILSTILRIHGASLHHHHSPPQTRTLPHSIICSMCHFMSKLGINRKLPRIYVATPDSLLGLNSSKRFSTAMIPTSQGPLILLFALQSWFYF